MGKPEGKRQLGRPRRRREGKTWIFRKWNVVVMDWIDMAEDMYWWRALVKAVTIIRVP